MTFKTIVSVVFWSALCLGIWVLSLSSVSDEELAVGAASSLACGVAAVAFHRAIGLRWSIRGVPWPALPTLLASIISDTAQVLVRPLARTARGRVNVVDVGARGNGAAATTRRAVATLLMSASPGTVVLDADDRGRMTFHSLDCAGPTVEDKVTGQ